MVISVWNVQNIFNATQDGNEYSEFLPTSGWTEQAYKKRLSNLLQVLCYDKLSSSDVFIFNEIENDSVVEDILQLDFFKKHGFIYYTTAGEKNGAIKTAVISKIPIIDVCVHNVLNGRPILQVEIQNNGEHIFILALHAKSNIEGSEETAPTRLKQAQVIQRVSNDIEKNYPGSLIIIAGDFNETYKEKNMMSDSRNSSNNTPLSLLPSFKSGYFYCPWLDESNNMKVPGSYYYNNEWKCYDNILVSYAGHDNTGWEYESSGVVFQGILQTTDNKPNAFKRSLLTGVSDHLPLWISFTRHPE